MFKRLNKDIYHQAGINILYWVLNINKNGASLTDQYFKKDGITGSLFHASKVLHRWHFFLRRSAELQQY